MQGTSGRILGEVWVFEHGVHDGLRAHDLARCKRSIQDGLTGRLHGARLAYLLTPDSRTWNQMPGKALFDQTMPSLEHLSGYR